MFASVLTQAGHSFPDRTACQVQKDKNVCLLVGNGLVQELFKCPWSPDAIERWTWWNSRGFSIILPLQVGPAVWASPGNFFQRQQLGPHPNPTVWNLHVYQHLGDIYEYWHWNSPALWHVICLTQRVTQRCMVVLISILWIPWICACQSAFHRDL